MYGVGILKGLGITLKHFVDSDVDDFKWGVRRYTTDEGFTARSAGRWTAIVCGCAPAWPPKARS